MKSKSKMRVAKTSGKQKKVSKNTDKTLWHICKYCGAPVNTPDADCHMSPNKS